MIILYIFLYFFIGVIATGIATVMNEVVRHNIPVAIIGFFWPIFLAYGIIRLWIFIIKDEIRKFKKDDTL
jgi:phosphotransferase system  glucose/maltose/N-acetylglucosamine-specific IIC component